MSGDEGQRFGEVGAGAVVADAPMNASVGAWIRAVLSGGQPDTGIDDASVAAMLQSADFEGVLPLLEWRLRSSSMWSLLPATLRDGLAKGARAAAVVRGGDRGDPRIRAATGGRRLVANGKTKMQAVIAVARKLLHGIHAMTALNQPWNSSALVPMPPKMA